MARRLTSKQKAVVPLFRFLGATGIGGRKDARKREYILL